MGDIDLDGTATAMSSEQEELLAKYVEAGWLGRKSGRGFYDYSSEEPAPAR